MYYKTSELQKNTEFKIEHEHDQEYEQESRNPHGAYTVRYSRDGGIIYGFSPRLRDRNGKCPRTNLSGSSPSAMVFLSRVLADTADKHTGKRLS
jgi:hypothetical protein